MVGEVLSIPSWKATAIHAPTEEKPGGKGGFGHSFLPPLVCIYPKYPNVRLPG